MKSLLFATISLTALPLFAADAQKTTTDAQAKPATTTAAAPAATTSTAAPAPAAQAAPVVDSPLVRAAKAASQPKKRKATIVITNDNLKKAGPNGDGFTTTKSQAPLPPLPPPGPSEEQMRAAKQRQELEAKQAADKAAKEKAAREARRERAAAQAEGDYDPEALYDDPATAEHRAEDANKPPKQDQKPPM